MTDKRTRGKTAAALAAVIMAVFAAGGADAAFSTDIVGRAAVKTFGEMLEAPGIRPLRDTEENAWYITAPDGEAAFVWRAGAKPEREYDTYIYFDFEPFAEAGLDMSKIPASMMIMDGMAHLLVAGRKLSDKPLEYNGEPAPLASFEQIVKFDREAVGYHTALDHFGVTLADGFMFEWAKDMSKNDKDIVFVLNPKPFIDAGVDPLKVKGWLYADVPLEDSSGRKFEAKRFLKPFNLK